MTDQEIFDRVAAHLLAQGVRSYGSEWCMYRNSEGLKCAVGCLIDDAHYSEDLENQKAEDFDVLRAVAGSLGMERIRERLRDLLTSLQIIHDSVDPADWRPSLMECAHIRNLEWNHGV